MALNAISLALPGTKAWVVLYIGHGARYIYYKLYIRILRSSPGDNHVTCDTQLDALVNNQTTTYVLYLI